MFNQKTIQVGVIMLEFIGFVPHPPIIIEEVGREETIKISATTKAMEKISADIKNANPDVIVAITPHGHVFSDAVTITALDILSGNLKKFGAPQIKVEFKLDHEVVNRIVESCRKSPIICSALDKKLLFQFKCPAELDHGLVVPLSFVVKTGWDGNLVPINMGLLPYEELYHFGKILRDTLDALGRSWVLLASGDMSHSLRPGSPSGYSPQGAVFDEIIRQSIREGNVMRIFDLEESLVEEAAECGLRPLIMALGALDGYEINSEELSYEGQFGVGYLVAQLRAGKNDISREIIKDLYKKRKERLDKYQDKETMPVKLARESIKHYLEKGQVLSVSLEYEDLKINKAGVFVSLKMHGSLRGCIGTVVPEQENIAQEIIHNAVSAAIRDPRFHPLQKEELNDIIISVDILEEPEEVVSMTELNPLEYGVIVSNGKKKGLLLPKLTGIKEPEEQIEIAKQKAGIRPDEPVKLERFRVIRYT
ncbi:MAG: AMMECR1 domain-containing protein [Firmicutes bacterium HGW-Firmicutes-12]|nr:MAG: AMMECR1 domain-containing protein [Firmicutes bacterium HGW-Firmicutes-12]